MFIEFIKIYSLPVLGGAVNLATAWFFAYLSDKFINRVLLKNTTIDPTFARLIGRVFRYSIFIIAIIAVLDGLGVEIASLVAALGIFGFAIAIGLRTTTNNLFSGLMLMILEPYKPGEYIEGERVEGVVESINLFHTVVVTKEGVLVTVPNGAMWARSVRNFSRSRPHCIEIDIVIGPGQAFSELQALIKNTLAVEALMLTEFEPLIRILEMKGKTMTIRASFWCAAENKQNLRKRASDAIRKNLTAGGCVVRRIGAPRTKKRKKKPAPPAPAVDEVT